MFGGFRPLSANFTPTPNQFFDEVVGRYPSRVVTVVAILIRATLGWEDPVTGDRRVEAELPLSAFLRPDLCENSARKGLAEAIAAGFIVRTATFSNRDGARYALRWDDAAAQQQAIERARRGTQDPILNSPKRSAELGGAKFAPPKNGGPKIAPPYVYKETKTPKEKNEAERKTLNVGKPVNSIEASGARPQAIPSPSLFSVASADPLERQVTALVEELKDWGSERRHRQLLSLCEQHGLTDLPTQALHATRQRQNREGKRGPVAKPGAYYTATLVKLLELRQVFVPAADERSETLAEMKAGLGLPDGATPEQMREALRASMGLDGAETTGEISGETATL